MIALKPLFPWYGGKAKAAAEIWSRFGGDIVNYVEPFFGSGAVLLNAPYVPKIETVNDADHYVANFHRAVREDPDAVAKHASHPVSEVDLHARHYWLVTKGRQRLADIINDPEDYSARAAGYWLYGLCAWVGSGWCSGSGPWVLDGGEWVRKDSEDSPGVTRKRPSLANGGRSVHRMLPDEPPGISLQRPRLDGTGRGVHRMIPEQEGVKRQRPHLADGGRGVHRLVPDGLTREEFVADMIRAVSLRLQSTRICCGDWSRVVKPAVTTGNGLTAVFLDPPYSAETGRDMRLYATDSGTVASDVRGWCLANGDNPMLRICLAGFSGEHVMPGWTEVEWGSKAGAGGSGEGRERLWFSPHCIQPSVALRDMAA